MIPLTIALEFALHFNGVAIDGPFQLYNALRRIDAGFRPGIDFQFFHGIGIPFVQFPLYVLFGRGLEGSELGRQLLSTLLFPAVFVVLFRVFTGDWRRTWYLTAIGLAASVALHLTALSNPLNGMLGLRSAVPTVIPAIYYVTRGRITRILGTGLSLGAAVFLSSEQGTAAVLSFCIVSAVAIIRSRRRADRVGEAAATVLVAIGAFVVLVALVAGRGTLGVLRYNFRAVPMDQFWYFGAPPAVFISSWSALPNMLWHAWPIGVALVLAVSATGTFLWRVGPEGPDGGRRAESLALLATYGLVSCGSLLGIFAGAYVQPCWRALIVLALVEATRISDAVRAGRSGESSPPRARVQVPRWMPTTAVLAIAWMFVATRSTIPILTIGVVHVVRDHVIGHEGFGATGIWPETLREDRAIVRAATTADGQRPTIWSTYAGWLEAQNTTFQPSSFDYVIHALGPENRARYLATFRSTKPTLVQTVLPTYAQYEPWIENTSWDLYLDLLHGYRIVARTPWSLFWKRQGGDAATDLALGDASLDRAQGIARLPAVPPSPGMPVTLLTVEVQYRATNPLAWLPLLGPSPRYLVLIDGAASRIPVTLDPYTSAARFPVVAVPGSSPALAFRTFSLLPGARVDVVRVRVWQTPVSQSNQAWLAEMVKEQSAH